MSTLLTLLSPQVGNASPLDIPNVKSWWDFTDESQMTFNYQSIVKTGTGTIGTNTITVSDDASSLVVIGNEIRMDGTDLYTVTNVVTNTITTLTSLTSSYSGDTIDVAHVSQHDDKAPVPFNISQGTAANQPKLIRNKLNGRSVVDWDGVNDRLITVDDFDIGTLMTLFVVGEFETGNDPAMFIEHTDIATTTSGFLTSGFGPAMLMKRGAGLVFTTDDANWFGTIPEIGHWFYNGSKVDFFVNGTLEGSNSGSLTDSTVSDKLFIGGRSTSSGQFNSDGYFAEIIIYDRALTSQEQAYVVREYISPKYNIPT